MKNVLKLLMIIYVIFFNSIIFAEKPLEPNVYTEDKFNIIATKDQSHFIIRLKSNPTTGYHWFLREYDGKLIAPVKYSYEAPNTKLIGAPGYEVWVFSI